MVCDRAESVLNCIADLLLLPGTDRAVLVYHNIFWFISDFTFSEYSDQGNDKTAIYCIESHPVRSVFRVEFSPSFHSRYEFRRRLGTGMVYRSVFRSSLVQIVQRE